MIHVAPFAAFWTGVHWADWVCCGALYLVRMFAVTAGYHRYFAHRSFKTSRWFQFVLAFLAESSAQKGALWWAAHHRNHHRYVDTPRDPHSPRQWGFLYAHVGWLYDRTSETDYEGIKDFSRYPELVVLNKLHLVPPFLVALVVLLTLGWSGLWIGFMLSTVLVWHSVFSINSLAHIVGKQRYPTNDDSRNNWWLAVLTMGEGWHNNHHFYQSSVRQGFYWWELDVTYYVLKVMERLGLVHDLREPPASVYEPQDAHGSR